MVALRDMKRLSVLMLILMQLSNKAYAEQVGDVYVGVSYAQTTTKDESPKNLGTYRPTATSIGVSVVALPNLALDLYALAGLNDSTNRLTPNATMTAQINNGYGFYLHPYLALSNSWSIYAKLGRQFGSQETRMRIATTQTTLTQTTFAHTVYGIGVSYNINDKWGISTDYAKSQRIPSEMTHTSTIGVGLRYKY